MKEKDTDEPLINEASTGSTLTLIDEEMMDELTETGNVNAMKLDDVIAHITEDQQKQDSEEMETHRAVKMSNGSPTSTFDSLFSVCLLGLSPPTHLPSTRAPTLQSLSPPVVLRFSQVSIPHQKLDAYYRGFGQISIGCWILQVSKLSRSLAHFRSSNHDTEGGILIGSRGRPRVESDRNIIREAGRAVEDIGSSGARKEITEFGFFGFFLGSEVYLHSEMNRTHVQGHQSGVDV
ncbi:uncharacterized protein LOC129293600 [Prosopis cineraria]|uniref:uncharacterized protein LOC129293600 n=1 Tax=Prosopis cineraria TaxID=364024 RepID=UPI0024100EC0|nr:uncharacterized protein LOC129293600 [Prosopis cineraria]